MTEETRNRRKSLLLPIVMMTAFALLLVPGYGAASTPHPQDDNSHPSPYVWTQGQIMVQFNGESPSFHVSALNDSKIGLSVSVQGVGEVNSAGNLVAYAPFSGEGTQWNLSWTNVSSGLVVNLTGTVPVGPASGPWNAFQLPEELYNGNTGTANVVLTFHLTNSSGPQGWFVKFDLSVQGWPWASSSDVLGMAMGVDAQSETHVGSGEGGDNVTEGANSTGAPVATLTWAKSANVTYSSGTTSTANVTSQIPASEDGASSGVRLLFAGVTGGYSQLFYDPSIWLNSAAFHGSGGLVAFLLTTDGMIALVGGMAVVLVAAGVALRNRKQRPSLELSGALPLCPKCGRAMSVSTGQGVRILQCEVHRHLEALPASHLNAPATA